MREIVDGLRGLRARGDRFALATVVRTWNSAPRQPGAAMAVAESGEVIGSVSGGCVEGAVYEAGSAAIESGASAVYTYGVSDDDAFSVGLTCGGTLEILVSPMGAAAFPGLDGVLADISAGRPVAVATVTAGATVGAHLVVRPDELLGTLGNGKLDVAVGELASGMLAHGRTGVVMVGRDGQRRMQDVSVFVHSFAPPPRLLVFGAIDFAGAMARMGKFLGYRVTVCDARPTFATARRFPDADEVVVQWPHKYLTETQVDERTVICVLTHDPKFDVPVVLAALDTPAAYIGAMGSRRTHHDRERRLLESGVSREQLARLASPIGLDLGSRTPEETAVAIAAEIIALNWGGSGRRLAGLDMAIHR